MIEPAFDGPPDKWSFLEPEGADDPTDLYDEQMNGSHYKLGNFEFIQIVEGMGQQIAFAWCRLNAMKYLFRAGRKQNTKQDLEKAVWYTNRMISYLEKRDERVAEEHPPGSSREGVVG
jgi:hypothetical protein